jgi:hypothetical protein
MLDVVTLYAKQWRFDTNHGKSNVVVIGSPVFPLGQCPT